MRWCWCLLAHLRRERRSAPALPWALIAASISKQDQDVEPLAVAKAAGRGGGARKPGLVICGKQAIDDDSNQTGQMLAALLGWAQGTFASGVELAG